MEIETKRQFLRRWAAMAIAAVGGSETAQAQQSEGSTTTPPKLEPPVSKVLYGPPSPTLNAGKSDVIYGPRVIKAPPEAVYGPPPASAAKTKNPGAMKSDK